MIRFLIVTFAIQFLATSLEAKDAINAIRENVTPITKNHSYNKDFDDARFRVKVYKADDKSVLKSLKNNPSNLCEAVKSSSGLDLSSTSSNYVVSVLKKENVIDPLDKNYGFISAHFLWEFYLTYRNFVDVSRSFTDYEADKVFSTLPEGYIVQVQKECVENGAVAIKCNNGFYTTKFPDFENLKERLDSPEHPECKVGKGLRLIVEAKRLYNDFKPQKRVLSSE